MGTASRHLRPKRRAGAEAAPRVSAPPEERGPVVLGPQQWTREIEGTLVHETAHWGPGGGSRAAGRAELHVTLAPGSSRAVGGPVLAQGLLPGKVMLCFCSSSFFP